MGYVTKIYNNKYVVLFPFTIYLLISIFSCKSVVKRKNKPDLSANVNCLRETLKIASDNNLNRTITK